MVEHPPASAGTTGDVGSTPDPEDPLKEEKAIHLSILAGIVPQIEEPGRLQSMGLQRVGRK